MTCGEGMEKRVTGKCDSPSCDKVLTSFIIHREDGAIVKKRYRGVGGDARTCAERHAEIGI
jgi:hypothetical protein